MDRVFTQQREISETRSPKEQKRKVDENAKGECYGKQKAIHLDSVQDHGTDLGLETRGSPRAIMRRSDDAGDVVANFPKEVLWQVTPPQFATFDLVYAQGSLY